MTYFRRKFPNHLQEWSRGVGGTEVSTRCCMSMHHCAGVLLCFVHIRFPSEHLSVLQVLTWEYRTSYDFGITLLTGNENPLLIRALVLEMLLDVCGLWFPWILILLSHIFLKGHMRHVSLTFCIWCSLSNKGSNLHSNQKHISLLEATYPFKGRAYMRNDRSLGQHRVAGGESLMPAGTGTALRQRPFVLLLPGRILQETEGKALSRIRSLLPLQVFLNLNGIFFFSAPPLLCISLWTWGLGISEGLSQSRPQEVPKFLLSCSSSSASMVAFLAVLFFFKKNPELNPRPPWALAWEVGPRGMRPTALFLPRGISVQSMAEVVPGK